MVHRNDGLTLWLNIDGTLYALTGARGTAVLRVNASAIPMLEFSYTGLFIKPSAQVAPTPTLTAFQKAQAASNTNTPVFTMAGAARVLRSLSLDLGVSVEPRFLIGKEEIAIVDRAEMLEAQIEAVALSAMDPWQMALDGTELAVALTHGATAGKILSLSVPTAQMQRPQGIAEAQGIKEWPLRMTPLPASGDDQWSLTLT